MPIDKASNTAACLAAIDRWRVEQHADSATAAYLSLVQTDALFLEVFAELARPETAPWLALAWCQIVPLAIPASLTASKEMLDLLAALLGTADRRLTQAELRKIMRGEGELPPRLDPPVTLANWSLWELWHQTERELQCHAQRYGLNEYEQPEGLDRRAKSFNTGRARPVWQWMTSPAWPLPAVRKDDDVWHFVLACHLNNGIPRALSSPAVVHAAVLGWKQAQGAQWRRVLALELDSVPLAYRLVMHAPLGTQYGQFKTAREVFDFKYLGEWDRLSHPRDMRNARYLSDPHSAKTLLTVFGTRTMDLLESRYMCQPLQLPTVGADGLVRPYADMTEPFRIPLSTHDIAAVLKPPYSDAALALLWKHHRTKRWDELVRLADNISRLEAEGLQDRPLGELFAWFARQPDLVLSALQPEERERWDRSLTADRGCYPTTLRVQERLLTGRVLERSDPRGLMLGDFTSCCQHAGGAAAMAAWHGQESQWGGVFVVEEPEGGQTEIKAGSWLWLQPDAEGVPVYAIFDSIEVSVQMRDRAKRDTAFNHDLTLCLTRAALALYRTFPSLQAVVFGPLAAHLRLNTAVQRPEASTNAPGEGFNAFYGLRGATFVPYLQRGGALVQNPDGSRCPGVFLASAVPLEDKYLISRPADELLTKLESLLDDQAAALAALPVHKPRAQAYANYV